MSENPWKDEAQQARAQEKVAWLQGLWEQVNAQALEDEEKAVWHSGGSWGRENRLRRAEEGRAAKDRTAKLIAEVKAGPLGEIEMECYIEAVKETLLGSGDLKLVKVTLRPVTLCVFSEDELRDALEKQLPEVEAWWIASATEFDCDLDEEGICVKGKSHTGAETLHVDTWTMPGKGSAFVYRALRGGGAKKHEALDAAQGATTGKGPAV